MNCPGGVKYARPSSNRSEGPLAEHRHPARPGPSSRAYEIVFVFCRDLEALGQGLAVPPGSADSLCPADLPLLLCLCLFVSVCLLPSSLIPRAECMVSSLCCWWPLVTTVHLGGTHVHSAHVPTLHTVPPTTHRFHFCPCSSVLVGFAVMFKRLWLAESSWGTLGSYRGKPHFLTIMTFQVIF